MNKVNLKGAIQNNGDLSISGSPSDGQIHSNIYDYNSFLEIYSVQKCTD